MASAAAQFTTRYLVRSTRYQLGSAKTAFTSRFDLRQPRSCFNICRLHHATRLGPRNCIHHAVSLHFQLSQGSLSFIVGGYSGRQLPLAPLLPRDPRLAIPTAGRLNAAAIRRPWHHQAINFCRRNFCSRGHLDPRRPRTDGVRDGGASNTVVTDYRRDAAHCIASHPIASHPIASRHEPDATHPLSCKPASISPPITGAFEKRSEPNGAYLHRWTRKFGSFLRAIFVANRHSSLITVHRPQTRAHSHLHAHAQRRV